MVFTNASDTPLLSGLATGVKHDRSPSCAAKMRVLRAV
jgi:hypothetical protein